MNSGPRHRSLDLSSHRRVLIAGDVHGEYAKLQVALDALGYEPGFDALVLAGDLADRGPDSPAALEWMVRHDVHRVLGNHDVMPGMLATGQIGRSTARKWGGGWFAGLEQDQLEALAERFERAPIAMTVRTPGGRTVGVVHADCGSDWHAHVTVLGDARDPGHQDAVRLSLWERFTMEDMLGMEERDRASRCDVSGIDHVFHGHTPVMTAFACGNRSWIDTGACYGDDITVVDMDEWIGNVDVHRLLG